MKPPRRLELLRTRLRELGGDLYLVSRPENIFWLSGFRGSNALLLVTAEESLLLTDFRYLTQAAGESPDWEICEVERSLLEGAARRIHALAPQRVVAESAHLSQARWTILARALLPLPLDGDAEGIETLRMIKDLEEIAVIGEAIDRTVAVFEQLAAWIRPGISEREITAELVYRLRCAGGEGESFPPIVATGENAACPHHRPTERTLVPGELLKLDFGMRYQGYCSDFTRMLAVASPDRELERIHAIVREAQAAALAMIRPGIRAADVDAAARKVIQAAGYGEFFGHGLGHGLGIEIHEKPSIAPGSSLILVPGMVFTVEPGIYLPGRGGVRIEDVVVVTADACRNLTRAEKSLRRIGESEA